MAFDPPIVRGDQRTFSISNLTDADGNPSTFAVDDIAWFTMKRHVGHPDSRAIIQRSTEDGGVELDVGQDTGTITIDAEDWPDQPYHGDLPFRWDLQLARNGDSNNIVTLAWDDDVIVADVTITHTAAS